MKLLRSPGETVIKGVGAAFVAGLPAMLWACLATSAHAAPDAEAQLEQAWRAQIAQTPTPHAGCFTADYPSASWAEVACVKAPNIPFIPAHGRRGWASRMNTGDGNDYAAVAAPHLISSGVGSFPVVSGVTSEEGEGVKNAYTIQLNSQFFASPTCSGAAKPASCLGWEQFVYFNQAGGQAFMQYWLINYAKACPAGGWMKYGSDCYRNSAAVYVPAQMIKKLDTLRLTGAAVSGGIDTVTMTTANKAFSATGQDSVVDLAAFWNASEFNIIGPGDGSEAVFNAGSSITVDIALKDGSTAAPVCKADDGTTGETNNLNLGPCTVSGGATPSVKFTESN